MDLCFGQLNPVNNLEWDHWYVMPHNYFTQSWDAPDPSDDTLVGYNIYRETELYRFQEENSLYHIEAAQNCGEDFVAFNDGGFYIHVTAVYNSSCQESGYIDSAYCVGYLVGIDEQAKKNIKIYPNPSKGTVKIESGSEINKIEVVNQAGKIVQISKQNNILYLNDLPKGKNILQVTTEKETITRKIILK